MCVYRGVIYLDLGPQHRRGVEPGWLLFLLTDPNRLAFTPAVTHADFYIHLRHQLSVMHLVQPCTICLGGWFLCSLVAVDPVGTSKKERKTKSQRL